MVIKKWIFAIFLFAATNHFHIGKLEKGFLLCVLSRRKNSEKKQGMMRFSVQAKTNNLLLFAIFHAVCQAIYCKS